MKKHLQFVSVVGLSVGTAAIALSLIAPRFVTIKPSTSMIQPAQAATPMAQAKPTIVKIYADWCPACQKLKPIVSDLQRQYQGKANFVVLDVSNRSASEASAAQAKKLGLEKFFANHKSQAATIAVINPNGQVIQQFRKDFNRQNYVNAIDQAITQTNSR